MHTKSEQNIKIKKCSYIIPSIIVAFFVCADSVRREYAENTQKQKKNDEAKLSALALIAHGTSFGRECLSTTANNLATQNASE